MGGETCMVTSTVLVHVPVLHSFVIEITKSGQLVPEKCALVPKQFFVACLTTTSYL